MLRSTFRGAVALVAAAALALGGATAAQAAPDPNWEPQTTVTITPSSCSANGEDVVLDITLNIADGEGIGDIRIDGVSIDAHQGAVHTASPGTHTYEWWVYQEAALDDDPTNDDWRILTGTFTVASCGDWVPQTTLTLSTTECAADGATVPVVFAPQFPADGSEGLVSITIDGTPVDMTNDVPEFSVGAGAHTYEYVIVEYATGDTFTSTGRSFTTAACDEEPAWTPQTTVTITPNTCSTDDAAVALTVVPALGEGEEITDIQVDGVSIDPEEATADAGVHSYTYWVRNTATGEVKTQTGTFTVQHCEETSETPSSNGDKTPTGSNGDTLAETGGGAVGGLAAMSALLLAAGTALIMWRRKALQH